MESPKQTYFNFRVEIIEAKKSASKLFPSRSPKQIYNSALKKPEILIRNTPSPSHEHFFHPKLISRDIVPRKLYHYYAMLTRESTNKKKLRASSPMISGISTKSRELISPFQNSPSKYSKRKISFPVQSTISMLPFFKTITPKKINKKSLER
ncbi:hypothetical protein SteCoe_33608 [Stentor coeruleus]|uniref:Uncharacterized protein n=1 Tax=Stentor coeruleus TaxID=5963 RepID=A0A1R2AWC1_9CILI|nr:hypothetical protein SteCoe_33608 [Stentor coeruleus]